MIAHNTHIKNTNQKHKPCIHSHTAYIKHISECLQNNTESIGAVESRIHAAIGTAKSESVFLFFGLLAVAVELSTHKKKKFAESKIREELKVSESSTAARISQSLSLYIYMLVCVGGWVGGCVGLWVWMWVCGCGGWMCVCVYGCVCL
jgi:hypothetical protein